MEKNKIIKEEDYRNAVLAYYKKYGGGDLSTYLLNPTPAKIKKACKELIRKKNEGTDQTILNQFLEEEQIKPGLFKSVQNHLKGETSTINSDGLELIATLIDFPDRPFAKYRKTNLEESSGKVEKQKQGEDKVREESSIGEVKIQSPKSSKESIVEIFINNKIKITVGIISLIFVSMVLWKGVNNSKLCMTWVDTHYEEVDCDAIAKQKFEVPPIAYDEKKFNTLKRIETGQWDTVSFFKEGKPNTWYAKTGNRLEFFRADYPHPVTGKALDEVTRYIIDKYVFTSIEKHMKKVEDSIRK